MEGLTQNEKIVWSCWETKTLREVVREAAAKGTHIALAHRFLQCKQSWDASTTKDWFTAEVGSDLLDVYVMTEVNKHLLYSGYWGQIIILT